MNMFLGIDFGTSYFKVGLFDIRGNLQGLGRVPVPVESPQPDWRELSVARFWRLIREGLAEALAQAGADANAIVSVSYASQANTFVVLDEADRPLTPLILWNDRRAVLSRSRIESFGATSAFSEETGFSGLAPEFLPAKWCWLVENERAVVANARRVMTLADYFVFSLTGERVGDSSTAVFTGLYSLKQGEWWKDALERIDLPAAHLSRPLLPGTAVAKTRRNVDLDCGIPAGIRMAVGGLDHSIAAMGSGTGMFADASISTGTVLAALTLVDRVEPKVGCFHGPYSDGRSLYRLAFANRGATQLEEYRERYLPSASISDVIGFAEAYSREEDGLTLSARRHGERIHHIMREICVRQHELLNTLSSGPGPERVVATGGGSRSPFWLQLAANQFRVPVITTTVKERACLGAAMFGALAHGSFGTLDEVSREWIRLGREFLPE